MGLQHLPGLKVLDLRQQLRAALSESDELLEVADELVVVMEKCYTSEMQGHQVAKA